MNAKYHDSEKGQAIVFLVLGLVVFLGFVALAIDGGMALADRRNSQNSADAAALAGGGEAALYLENQHMYYNNWNCNAGDVLDAMDLAEVTAVNRAAANNFMIDYDPSDHNGVHATCGQVDYGFYLDKFIDITVDISSTTQANFAQLIFPNALHNEVDATTRIRPRQPMVFGNAIVALNPAGCQGQQNGATFHGNALVDVTGGGIFSNGCLRANGNPDISVTGGGNYGHDIENGDIFDPHAEPVDYLIPPSAYDVTLPDCTDPDAHNVPSLPENMTPGLWCITGDLKINGGDTIRGSGVTIYVPNGGITINGNASVQITAPEYSPDPSPAIPGIVIYLPPTNHNVIKLNGTSDTFFIGTILAPGADIKITGTNGTGAYQSQIIGWNVEGGGTADTYVTYEAQRQHSRPTAIELYR